MSDTCTHDDHDHTLIWLFLFGLLFGLCGPNTDTPERVEKLETEIHLLKQDAGIKP